MSRLSLLRRFAVALGLAAALAACGGSEERKAKHLERGDTYFAEANYEKARIEYKNALQIDPKDVPARFGLAQTLERLDQVRDAVGHYRAVVDQDPQHLEARVRLGRVYLVANALDLAGTLADEILAIDPANPDGLVIRGGTKARRGDLPGAAADAEAALARDRNNTQALGLLASIAARQGNPVKAAELLERALANEPKSSGLRSALAGLYLEQGQSDRAVKLFEEQLALDPTHVDHRIRLAALLTSIKRPDDAERVLREAVSGPGAELKARLALVEFLASQRGKEVAEQELQKLIAADRDAHDLRLALARLYDRSSEPDKAKQAYREIIDRDRLGPKGLEARTRLAGLHARQSEFDQAGKLLDEVLVENPRAEEALVLRGNIALARNEPLAAIGDYRSALKGQPNSATLLTLLARAHLANREPQLAEENLRRAVDVEPTNLSARLALAQLLAQTGRSPAAIEQLDAGLGASPGNPGLMEVKARLQMAGGDWAGAVATAKALQQAQPTLAVGYYLQGVALQGKGDFPASAAAFDEAMKRAPKAVEPLTGMVQSQLAANEAKQAQTRLEKLIAEQPENAVAHNLRGEVLLFGKDYAGAEAEFRKAEQLSPQSPVPYRNRALARLAVGDSEGAVSAYREGIAATDGQPVLRAALVSLYEQLGRYEEAIGAQEEVLADNPTSVVDANNLAMLLVSYRTDGASLARAAELAARLEGSENPAFLDTLGWVQFRRGEVDAALANLQKAVEKAPTSPIMNYHLGMAYHARGDRAKAREHLQKAVVAGARYHGLDEAKSTLATLQ